MLLQDRLAYRLLLTTSLALLPAGFSAAQSSPPPAPAASNAAGLQDVVITARHRAERTQSVPISLTTVDHAQIKNLGSLNLNQIKQLVPSLTVSRARVCSACADWSLRTEHGRMQRRLVRRPAPLPVWLQ